MRGPHALVKPPCKRLILGAITDKAAIELDRLHRANKRWKIFNKGIGNPTTAQKCFGDFTLGKD